MRRVFWLIALVVLVWSGWWAVASTGAVRAIEGWLAARQSEGWQAEVADIAPAGYPFDIRVALRDVALADPDTGVAVQASALTLMAPAWDLGDVTLVLPDDPVLLASPEGQNTLLMQQAQARLSVKPWASMAMEQMTASAGAWLLEAETGDVMAGGGTQARIIQDTENTSKYALDAEVEQLRPGDTLRAALRIPKDWPVTFDRLLLKSTMTFERPWDITALEVSRPQPRQLTIHQAEAVWGALQLRFAADLDVDADGVPSGSVSLQARNWRAMLMLAQNSGAISPMLRPQIERALSTFAGLAGNSETLDLAVSLRGGTVYLGFLPLAPAPRLILR